MATDKLIVILKNSKTITYAYAFFSFMLAFPTVLIIKAIAAVIAIVISLIHLNNHQYLRKEMLNRIQLFGGFILLFLISLFGALNSNNLQNSLDLVIRQLPLLILPILILKLNSEDYLLVVKAFIYGIFSYFLWVVIFDSYYLLTRHSLPVIDINYLRYISSVRLPFSIHWNYLGLYVNFGIISTLFLLKQSKFTIFFIIVAIFLSPIILGKISFLILLSILVLYAFHKISRIKKKLKFLVVLVSITIFLFLIYLSIELKDEFWVSFESRIVLWKASVEIWAIKPLIGHGTNSVKELMNSYLSENSIIVPGLDGGFLDTHNIFAQALISHGLIGVAALILFFVRSYWLAKNNITLVLLITTILLIGQVEHIFQRQWGVLFVSFFIPFLIIHGRQLSLRKDAN